jgi:hypothetical protein
LKWLLRAMQSNPANERDLEEESLPIGKVNTRRLMRKERSAVMGLLLNSTTIKVERSL